MLNVKIVFGYKNTYFFLNKKIFSFKCLLCSLLCRDSQLVYKKQINFG